MESFAALDILLYVLSVVVAAGGTYLLRLAKAKRSQLAHADEGGLFYTLQNITLEVASSVGERGLPKIVAAIKSGEVQTKDQVKRMLYALGDIAYEEVRAVAPTAARDLGKEALQALIRRSADRVSPYPGVETAQALLDEHLVKAE